MILVVQSETADEVAVFSGDGREQVLDCQDILGNFPIEDGSIDLISGDKRPGDRVQTNVSTRVSQLA